MSCFMYKSKRKSKPLVGAQCARLACCAGARGQFLPGHFPRAGDKNAGEQFGFIRQEKNFST